MGFILKYVRLFKINSYIDIQIALLIHCRIWGTAINNKREAKMLSHAMVEKKDIEGGCWGLSECRAGFYGTLRFSAKLYWYNNCSLTFCAFVSLIDVLCGKCRRFCLVWFGLFENSLHLNTTGLLHRQRWTLNIYCCRISFISLGLVYRNNDVGKAADINWFITLECEATIKPHLCFDSLIQWVNGRCIITLSGLWIHFQYERHVVYV